MAPSRCNTAFSGIMLTYLYQLKVNKRLVHFQADCCSRDKLTLSFAFLRSSSELLAYLLFCPRFHNWSWRPTEHGALFSFLSQAEEDVIHTVNGRIIYSSYRLDKLNSCSCKGGRCCRCHCSSFSCVLVSAAVDWFLLDCAGT